MQGASAIGNYGHWILDTIPKLIIAKKFKDLNSFDAILIPNIKKNSKRIVLNTLIFQKIKS